jgi:hypothetical protein
MHCNAMQGQARPGQGSGNWYQQGKAGSGCSVPLLLAAPTASRQVGLAACWLHTHSLHLFTAAASRLAEHTPAQH